MKSEIRADGHENNLNSIFRAKISLVGSEIALYPPCMLVYK